MCFGELEGEAGADVLVDGFTPCDGCCLRFVTAFASFHGDCELEEEKFIEDETTAGLSDFAFVGGLVDHAYGLIKWGEFAFLAVIGLKVIMNLRKDS